MIEFKDLSFFYKEDEPLISHLDDIWEKGKIHTLIGPSGCGKSSLLYIIAGLTKPKHGGIKINSKDVIKGRDKTAVILQDHGLFPWKTVFNNLALGLKIRKEKNDVIKNKVSRMIGEMGLVGKDNVFPGKLSGGEKQRLAIGRALILKPDLLLLDEPFSALDAMTREKLQDRLWNLKHSVTNQTSNLTVILVTHSIEEAVFLSDKIHIMNSSGEIYSINNDSSGPGSRLNIEYFKNCVTLRKEFEDHQRGK